jgi:hypothetical protein
VAYQRCFARFPDGGRCHAPVTRGRRYCADHAADRKVDRTLLAGGLRRAIAAPDCYLAAALAELLDDDVAAALGIDPHQVWRLRLSAPPCSGHWQRDLQQLAELVDADVDRLEALLCEHGLIPV